MKIGLMPNNLQNYLASGVLILSIVIGATRSHALQPTHDMRPSSSMQEVEALPFCKDVIIDKERTELQNKPPLI